MIMNMMDNMNRNLIKMSENQDKLATGKNISSPIDDPVGIAKVLKYKTDLSELAQYEKNARDALSWLENTESALVSVGASYDRLKELAVQAANGTYSQKDTQKIKSEVNQIKNHIVNAANSTFAGRYIFSNYRTDKKLMNPDGSYNLDITSFDISKGAKTVYQVGVGENIEVNTNGITVFGYESLDGFTVKNFPDSENTGQAAKPTEMEGQVDLEKDYRSPPTPIVLSVGGTNYTVDLSKLDGSVAYPLKKEEVIEALYAAVDGGGTSLKNSGKVDIYYDQHGKLKIASKAKGSVAPTLNETNNVLFSGVSSAGTDAVPSKVQGASSVTDASVLAATGKESFVVTLNGKSETLTVDMNTLSNVSDLKTALQTAVDGAFPSGVGKITLKVDASSGNPLSFSTVDPDGASTIKKHTLSVRPIKSTKSTVMKDIDGFLAALESGDGAKISTYINRFSEHKDILLNERSNIGARVNRMELVLNRVAENNVNFTRLLSDAQDADMSEVIMYLKNSENVYRASLQTGARIIQPSLIDFLR